MRGNWRDFYENRVNSGYQEYFDKRYSVMIEYIMGNFNKHTSVCEAGIGIGSLANSLMCAGMRNYTGFDNSTDMLCLCKMNLKKSINRLYFDCIKHSNVPNDSKLVVTHGVLEHFTDDEIRNIIKRYSYAISVHYVPLDKYIMPSFGDERLLSHHYWLELVEPTEYYLFNDGYDLLLVK